MSETYPVEFSSEDLAMMKKEGIVFAHSTEELSEYGLTTQGVIINLFLETWKNTPKPEWSLLRGAKVLDIGAGSYLNGNHGAPWFARLCAVNGARVVVLDKLPQSAADKKLFEETIEVDLVPIIKNNQLVHLPQLNGRRFDIINSGNLVGLNFTPELLKSLRKEDMNIAEFEDKLVEQSGALLAEGGVMYLGQIKGARILIYQKDGENINQLGS